MPEEDTGNIFGFKRLARTLKNMVYCLFTKKVEFAGFPNQFNWLKDSQASFQK